MVDGRFYSVFYVLLQGEFEAMAFVALEDAGYHCNVMCAHILSGEYAKNSPEP
tara:strand:- start:316 stop:474 length:159 start_codon:yes stop_codon:yes gene_type:complete